jgi:DNA-binding NarL/FixJ family response regulator
MYDDEQLVARACAYGASGYLLKEATGRELVQAVRTVARGKLYFGTGLPRGALTGLPGEDPYERLTTRERQVFQLIAEGHTSGQAARHLGVTQKTVITHRFNLMRKLDAHNQADLVKLAVRLRVIAPA